MAFTEDHPRLVALEYFVARLLADNCLKAPDPAAALDALKKTSEQYSDLLVRSSNEGSTDATLTAIYISGELSKIVEEVEHLVSDG